MSELSQRDYQCLSDLFDAMDGLGIALPWHVSLPQAGSTLKSLWRRGLVRRACVDVRLTDHGAPRRASRERYRGWRITTAGIHAMQEHELEEEG